jgi:alpha-N-arabinofuranosidase
MHSIHIYTSSDNHLANVTAPLSAERAIVATAALIDIARIEAGVPASKPPTRICFDEWNVWDPVRAPGDKGAEEAYTLSDALAVAVWLNVFVRQSRYIGMANIAQTVNVISPLMTTTDGIVKQTTWWPLLLFSKHMRGTTVASHVRSGSYKGVTQPAWLQGTLEHGAPWLDVSAAVDDDGMVSMAVVNISDDKDLETVVKGVGSNSSVEVHRLVGPSVKATNASGTDEVSIQQETWDGQGKFVFPKHSFTMLRWKAT